MKKNDGRTYDTYTCCMWLPEHYESGDEFKYEGEWYQVIRVRSTGGFMKTKGRNYYDVLGFCYIDEILTGVNLD